MQLGKTLYRTHDALQNIDSYMSHQLADSFPFLDERFRRFMEKVWCLNSIKLQIIMKG